MKNCRSGKNWIRGGGGQREGFRYGYARQHDCQAGGESLHHITLDLSREHKGAKNALHTVLETAKAPEGSFFISMHIEYGREGKKSRGNQAQTRR